MRVVILMGGPSAEAEVSRSSAQEIAKALASKSHEIELLELDQQLGSALLVNPPDVVFPALHGPPGEDGTVQGFLDLLGLPYVGSGVHGSATAMDKALAKAVYQRNALPVADHVLLPEGADAKECERLVRERFGGAVVIKPLRQGSAIGVTPIHEGTAIGAAIEAALSFPGGVMVEPFVTGKETTVGVLDLFDSDPVVFPVIEVRTAQGEWYDYTNRYAAGKSEHLIPAPLSASVTQQLQEIALTAHRCLELRDLSRSDFIVTETDNIVLLETNTMPGMTPTSLFPDGAAALGMGFPDLVDALVGSALHRGADFRQFRRT